ncbi:hypothetical protein U1Q18_003159 [Sarracenia purpurea var. burkii]
MVGTVGGSIGLDAEYYCRRCDMRTELISHVTKLLQTCKSIDSWDEIVNILNIGSRVLRGSKKEMQRVFAAFYGISHGKEFLHQTRSISIFLSKMGDKADHNRRSVSMTSQFPAKRKGAGVRSWLVVSGKGNSGVEDLGKQQIMRRTGISAHDLRVLEPELSYPSAILRRERAIVVNLEHIKAIITANEVLAPNPRDPCIASFVRNLEFKLSDIGATMKSDKAMEYSPFESSPKAHPEVSTRGNSKPFPFEFRALEVCLESVCTSLESEVRDEFENLLDDDTDMAHMYLTNKLATSKSEGSVSEDELENGANAFKLRDDIDEDMSSKNSTIAVSDLQPSVEELEMLLGAYFVQIEGILNKLSTMREYVHNTEDYINIVLDEKQNQLLRMGVFISTATLMLTTGIVTSGLLSINVRIALFNFGTYAQWYEAAGGITAGCIFLYAMTLIVFKWKKLLG